MAHTLTINDQFTGYWAVTVNDNNVTSPYTLQNGDIIKVPTLTQGITINGTSYSTRSENVLSISNEDITVTRIGPEKTIDPVPYITINYTEPTDYIISETELITIADSIRTKTSSSDKLTPSAMAEKIKTIPIITDVNDAATLTAKLTENNIGNFYRYTGTATSDYATGAIYQVTPV